MTRTREEKAADKDTKSKWGGARPGAGRKRSGKRHDAPHRVRPHLAITNPVHVVLRVKKDLPRLRRLDTYTAIRRVLTRCLGKDDFRVVHLSIQGTHIHFLIEATGESALTHGMQSLAIRAARELNKELGRTGKVFEFRYHATQIQTSRHARHALAYVLNNWRRHREDVVSVRTMRAAIDPYSSGVAFRGWVGSPVYAIPKGYDPLPVSHARTWLLTVGWKQHGAIDTFEVPGPIRVAPRW
ncbi:MAG: hypothetical protein JWO36_1018 [Myxococcales bacterium]|nr:hypothetical protein [Myxococcales bacterium]